MYNIAHTLRQYNARGVCLQQGLPNWAGIRQHRKYKYALSKKGEAVSNQNSSPVVFRKTLLAQSISAAVIGSVATTGAAQEIEEITVTATKREESIQDVPLAITALTGDFVRDVNLDDIKDLVTFTPGVSGNSTDAFIDGISVRGVRTQDFGIGGDPSAAFFKNNLYEGRNGAVVTSLYDLERAEILRGPQGFLFGRNAIGGAFSVHTNRPTLDGASDGVLEVDVAEHGRFVFEGATNVGVSETFALRLAGYHSREDGHVLNAFDGQEYLGHDKTAFRVSGLYANDRLDVLMTAEYEDMDRDGSAYRVDLRSPRLSDLTSLLGDTIDDMPSDPRGINSDLFGGSSDDAKITTLGLHLDYDFDKMTLSWISGFKDHDYVYSEDYDATPRTLGRYSQAQKGDYLQSELRLTSNTDGPLSWYAGVSMYEENIDYHVISSLEEEGICEYYGAYYGVYNCADYFDYWQNYWDTNFPGSGIVVGPFVPTADGMMTEDTFVNGKFTGWAAYADLSYAINDMWDVSVGVRYTYDKKRFTRASPKPDSTLLGYFLPGFMNEPLTNSNDWDDTTTRAIVRFRPVDGHTLFASYTEGYKSGGFGTFAINNSTICDLAVRTDEDDPQSCDLSNPDNWQPVFQWFGEGDQDPLTAADGIVIAQFKPEDVQSIEFGWKGIVADGRVAIDVTAFTYDYKDLQVNYFDQGAKVDNVGKVDGKGLEGSIQWAINDNWDLVLAAGWLDTEAFGVQRVCGGRYDPATQLVDPDDVDGCEGNKLNWAPDMMGSAVLKADFPVAAGRIVGSVETFWESERGGGYEAQTWGELPSFQEWNLRVGYESDNRWSAMLYVENLTDELNYAGAQINSGLTPDWLVGPNRPRTTGLRFGYSFD